jgi:hypothetical protein
MQWTPLALCTVAIAVFYKVDVSQLMDDHGMHKFWGHLMMAHGFSWESFFVNFYMLFAEIGAGVIFWLTFGILGIAAFLFGIYKCATSMKQQKTGFSEQVRLYSALMLVLVIVLFAAGKFPLGEPRLNAFTIPAISVLLIYFLDKLRQRRYTARLAVVLSVMLYIGVIGNIYTTFFNSITGPEYAKKMNIYKTTEDAIIMAQAQRLPILVTPSVAYPYDNTWNLPFKGTVPGDWVLKTFPAYKVAENIPVYGINDLSHVKEYMKQLPPSIKTVMAGDGSRFLVIKR